MYISLYVVVNTFIGGRQPQNKLMRLRTFKKKALGKKCLLYFGITSMKEDTSAQLSCRGELHGGLGLQP